MSTLRTDTLQTTDSLFTININELAARRVVNSLNDLKQLPKTGNRVAEVLGYSIPNDGGGGTYVLDLSDTTTPDNKGTVIVAIDGGRWKLYYQGRLSIKQFGAKADGVTDNYQAILAAHSTGLSIYYPDGVYACSQKVVVSGKFGLQGAGANLTKIYFTGATQGFDVTQPTADDGFYVNGVTFLTNNSTNVHYALRINGLPQMSNVNDGLRNILGSRNKYRGKVSDVVFSGDSNATGWLVGLNLEAIMNCEVHNLTYTGIVPAVVGDLTGVALLINGDGAPTDIRVHGVWAFYAQYGILLPDYAEGVHVYDYEFVVVTYGIIARYTAGFSKLPSPSTGCLGFYVDQGHINCLQAGLIFDNANGMFITKQNIYMQPRAADPASRAIQISNGNDHRIRDVFVLGDGAQNTKSANYGILLIGIGLSFVDSVTASSLLSAVHLQGSSSNEIMNLQSRACVNVVSSDNGGSQNSIGPGRASGNTGSKYAVPFNNTLRMDEYTNILSFALTGGTTQVVSVPLPVGNFSDIPLFGSMVVSSTSPALNIQYQHDASSATQALFFISPVSPATNLPNATVKFGVNLSGI